MKDGFCWRKNQSLRRHVMFRLLVRFETVDGIADLKKDAIGAKYLRMGSSISFSELCSFVVELPILEYCRLEVKLAKRNEVKNLIDYTTFQDVPDQGQEVVGSNWVITQKGKHDGQKKPCKARLVARGYQEGLKPQSDSPTASKDSFKILIAVAANNNF